jgi:hypothetical protein
MDGKRTIKLLCLGEQRVVVCGPKWLAVECDCRHEPGNHPEFLHTAGEFPSCLTDVLNGKERHAFDPGIDVKVALVEPVVIGAGKGARPIFVLDKPVGPRVG